MTIVIKTDTIAEEFFRQTVVLNVDTSHCFIPSNRPLPKLPSSVVATLIFELDRHAHIHCLKKLSAIEYDCVDFAFTNSVCPSADERIVGITSVLSS
jgi:hypothetical protein